MPTFRCRVCGDDFSLPQHVLERYPGWTPSLCREHRESNSNQSNAGGGNSRSKRTKPRSTGRLLTPPEVLDRYTGGPRDGVFTDGGAVPNPGPGGWGAVYVMDDQIVEERHGHDPDTTNNRMELTALIEAASMVPEGTPTTVYTDSRLAVRTITEWAAGWERRGWKRKTGPVENLDLVKQAFSLYRSRADLALQWIEGHAGNRWNEYADALANAWRRA